MPSGAWGNARDAVDHSAFQAAQMSDLLLLAKKAIEAGMGAEAGLTSLLDLLASQADTISSDLEQAVKRLAPAA